MSRRRRTNLSPLRGTDTEQRFETHRRATVLAQASLPRKGTMVGDSPVAQRDAAARIREQANDQRVGTTHGGAPPAPGRPGDAQGLAALRAIATRRIAGHRMDAATAIGRRTTDTSRARIAKKFGITDPSTIAALSNSNRSFQPVPPGGGSRRMTPAPRTGSGPYPSRGSSPTPPTPMPQRQGGIPPGDALSQIARARRGRRFRRG